MSFFFSVFSNWKLFTWWQRRIFFLFYNTWLILEQSSFDKARSDVCFRYTGEVDAVHVPLKIFHKKKFKKKKFKHYPVKKKLYFSPIYLSFGRTSPKHTPESSLGVRNSSLSKGIPSTTTGILHGLDVARYSFCNTYAPFCSIYKTHHKEGKKRREAL